MRIACPSCSAEYDVPDSLLAGGPRQMRCTRCGHLFAAGEPVSMPPPAESVAAPPPQPAAEPPPSRPETPLAPPPAPPPPLSEPPAPTAAPSFQDRIREADLTPAPRTRGSLAAAWVLSLAIVGACGWAGYRYHADIVEAWPPAARFYQAVGLN
jgi:predicted Zn finger-like uncharacterized protein